VFADDEVGFQGFNVGESVLDIIVDVEVVDFTQVGSHEVQEFTVVINEYHTELLSLSLKAQGLDVKS
jgi:hypothetical protein